MLLIKKILNFENPWGDGTPPRTPPRRPANKPAASNDNVTDINDLLKDYKKKFEAFKNKFGGGKGGDNKKGSSSGILLIIFSALALWLVTGFFIIQPDEEGVVLRFGKYHHSSVSGLHYKFPLPIEKLYKVQVTKINSVEVGYRSSGGSQTPVARTEESLMLTGDENIVDINFEVQWKVKDGDGAADFLFNVRDDSFGATVKSAAESAMREVIGKTAISLAFAEGRSQIELESKNLLQEILDFYSYGVEIVRLQLLKVDPPSQVIDSFRDVQTARLDKEKLINQAESYRNDIVPKARGEAQKQIEQALGYKKRIVADSEGRAARFKAVYKAYIKAPTVTKKRLYLDMMDEVLSKADVTIIDNKTSNTGVLPYLPLTK